MNGIFGKVHESDTIIINRNLTSELLESEVFVFFIETLS